MNVADCRNNGLMYQRNFTVRSLLYVAFIVVPTVLATHKTRGSTGLTTAGNGVKQSITATKEGNWAVWGHDRQHTWQNKAAFLAMNGGPFDFEENYSNKLGMSAYASPVVSTFPYSNKHAAYVPWIDSQSS